MSVIHALGKRARILLASAGVTALVGCGPILEHGTPLQQVLKQDTGRVNDGYRLQAGDQVEVHHVLDPDYSTLLVIPPDGMVNVPGIDHPVVARGETIAELSRELTRLYEAGDKLKKPFFTLNLRAFGSLQIFVGGEVLRPGYLDMSGGDRRLMQVIMAAGGLLPTARYHEILVLRPLADGKQQIFSVDVSKVMHGTDLAQNVPVYPLDTVIVPRSDIASFDVWVDQHIRQALPIQSQGNLTYTNNPTASILK